MRRARSALPLLFFLLLGLAITYTGVLGGEVFYFRDLLSHHVPRVSLAARMWRAGEPPLWSALLDCGQPHLANPQNLALHPLQVFYLMLPVERAFAASLLLLFCLCGAGMYACARGLGAPVAGAIVAGAAFALSGFILSLGNLANLLAAAAPFPLTFLFAARAVMALGAARDPASLAGRRPWREAAGWIAAAGASFALQVLGGDPFVAALCLGGVAVTLPFLIDGSVARRLGVSAAAVSAVALLACLVDAAVLLPAAAFFPDTVRAWGFRPRAALQWSLHPLHLLELLLPGIFGDPLESGSTGFWGAGLFDRGRPFILALGLSKVTLLAAAAAALHAACGRRKSADDVAVVTPGGALAGHHEARFSGKAAGSTLREPTSSGGEAARSPADEVWGGGGLRATEMTSRLIRGLAWCAAIFTILALGRHGLLRLEWLEGVPSLPVLRYPVRFFLVTTFAICLLAAFGVEPLAAGARRRRWGRAAFAAAAALALAAATAGVLATGGSLPEATGLGIAAALARSALACGAIALALLAPDRRGWGAQPRALALAALAALEPLASYAGLNPTGPRDLLRRVPEAAAILKRDPGRFRIWRANSPPLEGLPDLGSPFLAETVWFRETLHPAYGLDFDLAYAFNATADQSDSQRTFALGRRLAAEDLETRARVLGSAGVKYFLAFAPAPGGSIEGFARVPLAGPDLWIWRNHLWVPTVRVARRALHAPDAGSALEVLLAPGRDAHAEVILEEEPERGRASFAPAGAAGPPAAPGGAAAPDDGKAALGAEGGAAASGEVAFAAEGGGAGAGGGSEGGRGPEPADADAAEILEERASYIKVRARAAGRGHLVLSDRFAPGWIARLDGDPAPILRADYMFRAISLPPGEHTVEFFYRPASFRAGCFLSLLGLLATALLAWRARSHRRSVPTSP